MFALAFLIGVYANGILLLGFANLLTQPIILLYTLCFIFLSFMYWYKFDERFSLTLVGRELQKLLKETPVALILLAFACGIVLIGVLAPEIAFDSLWYHLTLPKIYLAEQGIVAIPGSLLYYSTMPKLGELLYTAALALQSEILAKVIHASFAVLTGVAIYCMAKQYLSRRFALIAVVIFLSNIVVLWEATTAYIDLIRTFFEVMSFWGLVQFIKTREKKWLVESALLMGLSIETKFIAVTSLVVSLTLLFFSSKNLSISMRLVNSFYYLVLALLVPLPWFVFSFIHTGNPFYPLLSEHVTQLGQDILFFPQLLYDPILIFFQAADPISPLYLIIAPLFILVRKNLPKDVHIFFAYSLLAILVWTITPKIGGGRFLLPYLPVFSIAAAILVSVVQIKGIKRFALGAVVGVTLIALVYRGVATWKYLPVVFGQETKDEFLKNHLDFKFGDFYDIDGEFSKQVKPGSTVLLYGFHNLYYVNVPFIHESWVKKGDTFEYIATQHTILPERFALWQPIYTNPTTGVTLYTGGIKWIY